MAAFTDYQSQTMAASDFTLYPYQETSWTSDQSYLPASTYADQAYLNATTFDTFAGQQAFIHPGQDQYQFTADPFHQHKTTLQAPSENYSPTNSASHSFDFQNPPNLSSTSDSGHSTISSAIGSPSAQYQSSNDWSQQQQTMSMHPNIVHQDSLGNDLFATSGFDLGPDSVTDKNCVGELNNISSSRQPSLSRSSLPSSFSLLSNPGAMLLSNSIDDWSLPATDPASLNIHSLLPGHESLLSSFHAQASQETPSPSDSVFKSPATPASAIATSPTLDRVKGKHRASIAQQQPRRMRAASPLATSTTYSESDVPPRPQAPAPTFTSPFFSQSSGHFVPPLESSYPSLIQPFSPPNFTGAQFPEMPAVQSPQPVVYPQAPSPAPSRHMVTGKAPSASPYMGSQRWAPYPTTHGSRRPSISSVQSRHSHGSISSDDSNKGLCPIPTCGRHVKDLKAHMLTHQNERPEKCPIPTCDYHIKGFARKYDKNRHTLTHYKGTMVCGFCPGSGSAAEKSFNRADVFKRHLTSVHGVEQTPPNARRKSPAGTSSKRAYGPRDASSGMCSTCGNNFANAQDFYEHLDDCVLRVVQQADPSEAINEKLLGSVVEDKQVQETMEKHMLPTGLDLSGPTSFDEDEEADEEEELDEEDANDGTYGSRSGKSGKGAIKSRKAAGNSS